MNFMEFLEQLVNYEKQKIKEHSDKKPKEESLREELGFYF